MKHADRGTAGGGALRQRGGAASGAPELDTYKQTLQPSNDAGSGPFQVAFTSPCGVWRRITNWGGFDVLLGPYHHEGYSTDRKEPYGAK